MPKLTTEYRKKLLFYFFFVSQTYADVEYSTQNKLKDRFNEFLTENGLTTIGQKSFLDFLKEYKKEITITKENDKKLILTDYGEEKGSKLEEEIEQAHIKSIMEFFDLDIETNLFEDLEKDTIIYPIPAINEAYGEKNFFWFYRGNEFTRKYRKFYSNFLTEPWHKTFGLVYGPSNSGKTSFLKFLTTLNKRKVIKNYWIEENEDVFNFKKTRLEYQNKISNMDRLREWLSDIRWEAQKQLLNGSKDSNKTKISIGNNFLDFDEKLADLNYIFGRIGKKSLLILDQAENLLEEIVKNRQKAKTFVENFLCKFSHLENIALILSISNEYYATLKTVLDKADKLEMKYEEFLIKELELDLIAVIIREIRKKPVTKRKLHFKPIVINDSQIELIKKAVQHGESFMGTELMIILNDLRESYGQNYNTEIIIPELTQETYNNILKQWKIKKIEERVIATKYTEKWWEYSLLKELVKISPNLIAPCPIKKIEEWYNHYKKLLLFENVPQLQSIIKNLTGDGLIYSDNVYIQFKHQYVLTIFKERLDKRDLILINKKKLWDAEIELTSIPRLNPFKEVFEYIDSLPELLYDKQNLEKLSRGLIHHHSQVDIPAPSQEALDKIMMELLNQLDDLELEKLLSLFKDLNEKRGQFFGQYRKNEPRTWHLLGEKWIDILSKEFDPITLSNVINEIHSSDIKLANDLSKRIFIFTQENFIKIFTENIRLFKLLNNLSTFQPFLIGSIERYQWEKTQEVDCKTIRGIIENISSIIREFIEDSRRKNNSDEKELVQKSFVYRFFTTLSKHVQWEKINWNELTIEELYHLLGLFDNHLELPEEIMAYDWSNYLESNWLKNPDKVLILLSKRYNFTSNYMVDWLEEKKFPQIEDFVNANKLGLLNYFLRRILAWNIFDKSKIFDLLNQKEFSKDNLLSLIKNSYYPALHDFQKVIKENHSEKLTEFKELIGQPTERGKYLNRYHRNLMKVFSGFPHNPIINSHEFISNTTSFGKTYSWYWPFLTLPSIFDLVLIMEKISNGQEKELVNRINSSIKKDPELWNNIFDEEYYLKSFEDFYPGTKESNYLKEKDIISAGIKEPTLEQLRILHYLGLTIFFYQISKTKGLYPVLELLIDKTHLVQRVFDEKYINKIYNENENIDQLLLSMQYDRFGMYFSFSRQEVDIDEFGYLIRKAVNVDILIETFCLLLNNENPVVFTIIDNVDVFTLTNKGFSMYNYKQEHPEKYSQILIQIVNGKKDELSKFDKLWAKLFGLEEIANPISSLGIDFKTLESLMYWEEREKIIEKIPWKRHLSKMTNEELKQLVKQLNDGLLASIFKKKNGLLFIDSFVRGILEIFPKWYQISCGQRLNKLTAINGLIYTAKMIGHQKDRQLYINKIAKELESEDWLLLLLDNSKEEEPIREIMDFLETADQYPKLIRFQNLIVENLITNDNLIARHFGTFADTIVFLDWLIEKYLRKKERETIVREFLRKLSLIPLTVEPTGYHRQLGAIKELLNSESLRQPEIRKILTEMDLFSKIKDYIVKQVNKNDYYFRFLAEIYEDMCKLQGKEKGKEFIENILKEISMEKIFVKQQYFNSSNIETLTKNNKEFIKILVETENFNNIDWTKIGNKEKWYSYYSFIEELDKRSEPFARAIIRNPSFWKIRWIDFIKTWLINNDKRIITYFKFLGKFGDERVVNEFLCSTKLLECPWEDCKLKISQTKKEPSLLSIEEFNKLIEILQKYNPAFNKLIN